MHGGNGCDLRIGQAGVRGIGAAGAAEFLQSDESYLADMLIQPIEYGYTVESLSAMAAQCNLELLQPSIDQFDQALGRIISPYSFAELEILRCPFDRGIMVLTHRTADAVEPGIYAYMVGNLATAER